MKLQSELRNALDVMIDEHENVEIPSQSDIKSMGYVEVGSQKISKNTLVGQLNGNPTLT